MKLVVLGDPHFGGGYALGRIDPYRRVNSRLMDHENTMGHVVDFCADHDVSALVITGDIYEHRRPDASQISAFSEKLAVLTDIGVDTHIVVGNHDLVRAHKTTTIDMLKHLRLPNVHVWSEIDSVYCEDPRGGTGINLAFMPFRTRQMLDCSDNASAVERLKDRLQFEVLGMERPGPKIVVGHLALEGARNKGILLDQYMVSEIVLPVSMFGGMDLDAVVMGHIHQHQVLCKDPLVVHVGAMERSDFGEASQPRYFLVVDTDTDPPSYNFRPLPVRGLYDIAVNRSSVSPDDSSIMDGILDEIRGYASQRKLSGCIARVDISVNDAVVGRIDSERIKSLLMKELGVHHCTGVSVTVVSKRQLRSSEITERVKPKEAFNKWLELVDDDGLRERLRRHGNKIIDEFGSV